MKATFLILVMVACAPARQVGSAPAPSCVLVDGTVSVGHGPWSVPTKHMGFWLANAADSPCNVERYVVSWPDGRKEVPLHGVTIAGRGSDRRMLSLTFADGDLGTISEHNVRVACACGPP